MPAYQSRCWLLPVPSQDARRHGVNGPSVWTVECCQCTATCCTTFGPELRGTRTVCRRRSRCWQCGLGAYSCTRATRATRVAQCTVSLSESVRHFAAQWINRGFGAYGIGRLLGERRRRPQRHRPGHLARSVLAAQLPRRGGLRSTHRCCPCPCLAPRSCIGPAPRTSFLCQRQSRRPSSRSGASASGRGEQAAHEQPGGEGGWTAQHPHRPRWQHEGGVTVVDCAALVQCAVRYQCRTKTVCF